MTQQTFTQIRLRAGASNLFKAAQETLMCRQVKVGSAGLSLVLSYVCGVRYCVSKAGITSQQ